MGCNQRAYRDTDRSIQVSERVTKEAYRSHTPFTSSRTLTHVSTRGAYLPNTLQGKGLRSGASCSTGKEVGGGGGGARLRASSASFSSRSRGHLQRWWVQGVQFGGLELQLGVGATGRDDAECDAGVARVQAQANGRGNAGEHAAGTGP